MRRWHKAVKSLIITCVVALLTIYSGLYILLSTPVVQQKIAHQATISLSQLLRTRVEIGSINIYPFDKIAIYDIFVADQQGDTLLFSKKLVAGFELATLIQGKRLVFKNVQLSDFDLNTRRTSAQAPVNYQFILDALAPKDKEDKKDPIQIRINTAIIRNGHFSYQVDDASPKPKGEFDPNHIDVNDIRCTFSFKEFSKDTINISVKRLSAVDRSGLKLNKLAFSLFANKKEARLDRFELQLRQSKLLIDNAYINFSRVDSLPQLADSAYININMQHSRIVLNDIAPLVPIMRGFDYPIDISCGIEGRINHLDITRLNFDYNNKNILLRTEASIDGISTPDSAYFHGNVTELKATPMGLKSILKHFSTLPTPTAQLLDRLGTIRFKGDLSGLMRHMIAQGSFTTQHGTLNTDVRLGYQSTKKTIDCAGVISTASFNLGAILAENNPFGRLAFRLNVDVQQHGQELPIGKIKGIVNHFDFKGYNYSKITINGNYNRKMFTGLLNIDDPNLQFSLNGEVNLSQKKPVLNIVSSLRKANLTALHLVKEENCALSLSIKSQLSGDSFDNMHGELSIDSITYKSGDNKINLDNITIKAYNDNYPQSIILISDIINGIIVGEYSIDGVKRSALAIAQQIMPSLNIAQEKGYVAHNDFYFKFNIKRYPELGEILHAPFSLYQDANIEGNYNDKEKTFGLFVKAPLLKNKKGESVENFTLSLTRKEDRIDLRTSMVHLNKKQIRNTLKLSCNAEHDLLNVDAGITNADSAILSATLSTTTYFTRTDGNLTTHIDINPSELMINDTVWFVSPARIKIKDQQVTVRNFEVKNHSQYLTIDGSTSPNADDILNVSLMGINLKYIFDIVNIPNVNFSGIATGDFSFSGLQSRSPRLFTPQLSVKGFGYNHATIGDLRIYSEWDDHKQGILLKGVIEQPNIPNTNIYGHIFPIADSISMDFDAHQLKIDFLRPFLQSIVSNMSGSATGKVSLIGNFSRLNVLGDPYLKDLTFSIDYLNTTYTISDTIHLSTSGLTFKNITLHDDKQNTGRASGRVNWKNFTNISYDINLFNLNNFKVFNVTEKQNQPYWGTVFGSGGANIRGNEKETNINVNMQTRAGTKFTFALLNDAVAEDHPFIVFSSRAQRQTASIRDTTQLIESIEPIKEVSQNKLSITLQIDITPLAQMQLLLDPASGDMLKGVGNGSIRLDYSTTDDIKMYGTYTVERGSYNFSLQDIILRDFTLKQGGTISFRGDPMKADLDIAAIYNVSANLLDLDATLADNSELSRTTVPVHAVLQLKGSLLRPDLAFDIEFPTISTELSRRVRSIINTPEMINKQIIYLLALGKFYTPDYMNTGVSRSNDLAAVASSTLSSTLNNMLGQITENVNIGTNIRSDKGDFSDVEVELALSSQLLNNRLLLNGNFGYRDKAASSGNNFIGDFDVEYLLTPNGNLRLKGYNRYNDRNSYLKSAPTTQGVGIMVKKDFSSLKDFFSNKSKKKEVK